MKVREVIRLIEDHGWHLVRTTGSHRQFRHDSQPGTVTVAGKESLVATGHVEQHPQTGRTEEMSAEYIVVIEKSDTGFGAYVPDLPGCVAVGETREETLQLVREAIELHLASLREAGEPVPPPTSTAERVSVHVAA